ncbi:MAG TPA: HNH endonuclease [Dokdonella sp.]|uniref:HNH endonuclease n=1 Tax=Dokdonella sp. TaxID=2291710 RepID=UPI002D7E6C17|nr:HNH endonuclease [Dokdonella sp.]HET9031997.1 HNH endonuclease [Dokdonella sp.]
MKTNYRYRAAIGLTADANAADPYVAGRAQARLLNFDAYIAEQFPRWLERQIAENQIQPNGDARPPSPEIKLIRAHLKGLVRLHRSYTMQPPNWAITSLQLKHQNGLACNRCRETLAPDELHAHHIVFRSCSGANNRNNLVVLCIPCHQLQHDHPIGQYGGEPEGVDDSEDDPLLNIDGRVPERVSPIAIEVRELVVLPAPQVSTPSATLPRILTLQLGQNSLPQCLVDPPTRVLTPRVPQPTPPAPKQITPKPSQLSLHNIRESEYTRGAVFLKLVSLFLLVFGILVLVIVVGATALTLFGR